MTDTKELEVAIIRAGLSKRKLAQALGLSEMGLYKKINNLSEFKASEIDLASKVLSLSYEQRDAIFFATNSDL